MKNSRMTWHEWAAELAKYGSDQDVIYFNKIETTPNDLCYRFDRDEKIMITHITYFGGKKLHKIFGPAIGMLEDRVKYCHHGPDDKRDECFYEIDWQSKYNELKVTSENERLRLYGLLRVANTERNDTQRRLDEVVRTVETFGKR